MTRSYRVATALTLLVMLAAGPAGAAEDDPWPGTWTFSMPTSRALKGECSMAIGAEHAGRYTGTWACQKAGGTVEVEPGPARSVSIKFSDDNPNVRPFLMTGQITEGQGDHQGRWWVFGKVRGSGFRGEYMQAFSDHRRPEPKP